MTYGSIGKHSKSSMETIDVEVKEERSEERENQVEFRRSVDGPETMNLPLDFNGDAEATTLKALAADVRDQDELERDIGRQVRLMSLPTTRYWSSRYMIRQICCLMNRRMSVIRSASRKPWGTESMLPEIQRNVQPCA